jgi:hypothetical protein
MDCTVDLCYFYKIRQCSEQEKTTKELSTNIINRLGKCVKSMIAFCISILGEAHEYSRPSVFAEVKNKKFSLVTHP